jgi:hypothetical protein
LSLGGSLYVKLLGIVARGLNYNSFNHSTVDILPIITSSGDNTAGGGYSLVCSTSTITSGQPTIIWLDPMSYQITSGVMMNGSMSTLTFNPLAASHAGTYTCRATLDSAMDSASVNISVESE